MSSLEIEKEKTFLEKISNKLKDNDTKSIVFLLFFAFFARILFSLIFNTGHPTDLTNFKVWAMDVNKKGIFDFFQPAPKGTWCDYPPGYIWILYFFGKIYSFIDPTFANWSGSVFSMFIKLPGIISDILSTYAIYYLSRRYVPTQIAMASATIFAFQPAIFYESAVWGQMDSVTLLFLILSIIFLIDKKYDLAILITALNCMMKPQGILLIPLIAFVSIYNTSLGFFYNKKSDSINALKKIGLGFLYSFLLVFTLTLPITKNFVNVIPWLFEHYTAQANLYPYSAIQSFNLWAITGLWQNDSRTILGISHKIWGLFLYAVFYAFACYYYVLKSKSEKEEIEKNNSLLEKEITKACDNFEKLKISNEAEIKNIDSQIENAIEQSNIDDFKKLKLTKENEIKECTSKLQNIKETLVKSSKNYEGVALIHAATIALLAFFIFPTRMHERYLFPGLSFLAISASMNFKLKNLYYTISGIFLLNLFYEFPGDKPNIGAPPFMTSLANFLKSGQMYTNNFGLHWYTLFAIANVYIVFTIFMKLWKEKPVEVDENELIKQTQSILVSNKDIDKKSFILPKPTKIDLKDWGYILGISIISFISRYLFLASPEEMVFDEVYHARAAGEYLRGLHPFEWVHPPLAKLLISVGVNIFGLNSFGWRIMPVIFGTLFIPVMYIFGKSLFEKRVAGILAATIIAVDGVFFVQSRTAMTNIFATFFQLTSIMFFWLYVQSDFHKEKSVKKYTFFALSGLFISLALSTRWTSMGALAFILGSMIWYKLLFNITIDDVVKVNLTPLFEKINKKQIPFLILFSIFFVLLPAIVYIISYIPFLTLNHTVQDIIDMQKGIYTYHKNLRDPHPYYSEWYTWPFLIRPTWYYFRDFKDGTMAGIIALGNPAIWWSSIFVTIFALYKAIKEKQANLLYTGLGFVILYLPWAVSPRIKNFNHYLFEAIPYACLSITFLIIYLWEKGNAKKENLAQEDINFNRLAYASMGILGFSSIFIGLLALWTLQLKHTFPIAFLQPYSQRMFDSVGYLLMSLFAILFYTLYENGKFRTLSVLYFSSIIGMFIFFYPLFSGYPMQWWYYSLHIWMNSWI